MTMRLGEFEKCILIVDDEPFIRILLEQTLEDFEDLGVEILVAADGEEALDLAKANPPALIFLDVMMPKVDGYEVCRRLKADPVTAGSTIVLLTAKGQEIDRIRGIEAGADDYMTKPFDPDQVVAKAEEVLGVEL